MITIKTILAFSLLAVVIESPRAARAQTGIDGQPDIAQMRLENVRIGVQGADEFFTHQVYDVDEFFTHQVHGVVQFFTHLSLAYDIPIGLEVARNDNHARNDDDGTSYSIDFKEGTLGDLLTQFTTQHKEYTWRIEDGVVNIVPKADYRDTLLKELLTIRIDKFSVRAKTGCWAVTDSLVARREIKRIIEANRLTYDSGYFGGFYLHQLGQHFTLEASNLKVESILNRVVRESPVAKIWIIKRDIADRKLLFRIDANNEAAGTMEEPSPQETEELIRRSLTTVVTKADLRRRLGILPEDTLTLFLSKTGDAYNVENLQAITSKEVRETIKSGRSVRYVEYCCVRAYGPDVMVTLNYHTPAVKRNWYIEEGIRLEFRYHREPDGFGLEGISLVHF